MNTQVQRWNAKIAVGCSLRGPGFFEPTTNLQLETLTYTPDRWILTITDTPAIHEIVGRTSCLNLRITLPPLLRFLQSFRERRETDQVVGHFSINCVGWSLGRTPWQATNTHHLVSQLARVILQTHINWAFLFSACLKRSRSADEEKTWDRASGWLQKQVHRATCIARMFEARHVARAKRSR